MLRFSGDLVFGGASGIRTPDLRIMIPGPPALGLHRTPQSTRTHTAILGATGGPCRHEKARECGPVSV
jgi:hypothetical protein